MSNELFSVRMGIIPPKPMQVNRLNETTRKALYKVIYKIGKYPIVYVSFDRHTESTVRKQIKNKVGEKFLTGYSNKITFNKICETCISLKTWHHALSFIEYIYITIENMESVLKFKFDSVHIESNQDQEALDLLLNKVNYILKEERVGYSFCNGRFIPVINEKELESIKQAQQSPYEYAANHIKKATELFSNRQNPDYANCIKESISAVESLAEQITDENNFDKAIEKLDKKDIKIHPQFKQAMKNLYQFASNDNGIRHGATNEPIQCNEPTARYMLITCSAFVNYLTSYKTP